MMGSSIFMITIYYFFRKNYSDSLMPTFNYLWMRSEVSVGEFGPGKETHLM